MRWDSVSAVMTPRNSYPDTLGEIAASYVLGIVTNHGYQNGNKRTGAIALTGLAITGVVLSVAANRLIAGEGYALFSAS